MHFMILPPFHGSKICKKTQLLVLSDKVAYGAGWKYLLSQWFPCYAVSASASLFSSIDLAKNLNSCICRRQVSIILVVGS